MAKDYFWNDLVGLNDAQFGGRKIKGSRPPRRIISYYIDEIYHDFRDYITRTLYLYLPYCGIVELPAEQFVGHNLSIDLYVDCRTGNIKYYILSDSALAFMKEGCIRQTMPVSSQNAYQASLTKLGGIGKSVEGLGEAATGNIVGGVVDVGKGLFNITKPAKLSISGSFTPSTAIHDSTHIYLVTVSRDCYYGDGIQSRYGYPDNRFITIGSCSGYVEIADAELHTSATEEEQMEILSLLMQGVII